MTTFEFNIKPSTYNGKFNSLKRSLIGKKFFNDDVDRIKLTSNGNEKDEFVYPAFGNGLLGTMYMAYSEHIPLVLRPDDLWIAIVVSFGNYVKNNSEKMKNLFVDHVGKKQLVVKTPGPGLDYTKPEHWMGFIEAMTGEIKKNVKINVNWMAADFTTSTDIDKTVCDIALMGTISKYFDMKFEICCGLSKVTLK